MAGTVCEFRRFEIRLLSPSPPHITPGTVTLFADAAPRKVNSPLSWRGRYAKPWRGLPPSFANPDGRDVPPGRGTSPVRPNAIVRPPDTAPAERERNLDFRRRARPLRGVGGSGPANQGRKCRATRNPMLLFLLSGWLLLRLAERQLSALLFQDPPRSTRFVFGPAPRKRPIQRQAPD